MFSDFNLPRQYGFQKEYSHPQRKAGVLLHITSLPGKYGTGDLGEEAFQFIDFLVNAGQSYWQTLPLSPVTPNGGWSPYSSPSAFAGNSLLISPDRLCAEGLLTKQDIEPLQVKSSKRSDFELAGKIRDGLLRKAFNVMKFRSMALSNEFTVFCNKEAFWLNDYTMFLALRDEFPRDNWSRWIVKLRDRDESTLQDVINRNYEKIEFEKFRQFIFFRQWNALREYARGKGIAILGDLPFYVSFNSSDVWANREIFKLDKEGKMKTVAGVPPDYFNSKGQLWSMPVYNWEMLHDRNYSWWIKRLEKNLQLFDLLRLDHFRAFSAFWEIPAADPDPVKGKWTKGPGSNFLNVVRENFEKMPFIAEDLGDIDQDVYDLKDQFGLPGMQVLQFSFEYDMHSSIHTPHNHKFNSLVYTGTHDNNTIRGWYEKELNAEGRHRLNVYAGKHIQSENVHFELIQMAFASDARIAVIPVQDYLGLGQDARMNIPSTPRFNWLWKLKSLEKINGLAEGIRKMVEIYGRL